jgi:medium-chain acyl-[acyl-carrier-protein] hydrolase
VCPVELPGRGLRFLEPPVRSICATVSTLSADLRDYLGAPFAFFGHSMGAVVAFELARKLRAEGLATPTHMFVSAHRAPHLPSTSPRRAELPDPELVAELRALNGTPEEVLRDRELLEMMLPIVRADFAACETYTWEEGSPLSCPMVAFGGLRDAEVPRPDLDAWRVHTSGEFSIRLFDGDHFFLHEGERATLSEIARAIKR